MIKFFKNLLNAKRKGEWVCCPFHAEATPSLFVDDIQYYCYGCGKSGKASDLILI